MNKTLLVMAGGTGGHVFPAIAVAEYLRAQGWRIVWLGTRVGMEAKLVPQHNFPLEQLDFAGVRGNGLRRWLSLPWVLSRAIAQSVAVYRRYQPDVVLGMGGFTALPGGLAARFFCHTPLVIHEQNAVAGMTNKILATIATRVLAAFPQAFARQDNKYQVVGNPVREAIQNLSSPALRYATRQGPLRVLVIGGSLGAQALNTILPAALAKMPIVQRPQVIHQAGEKHLDSLRDHYARAGVNAECIAFISDMASAYAAADVVICRAGALTVAEVAAAGVAAIFVPYPHAVDDHQTANARYLTEAGAAWLVPQATLNATELAQLLASLQRTDLARRAQIAHRLGKPSATAEVAQVCALLSERVS